MNRIIRQLERIQQWKQKYQQYSTKNNMIDVKLEDLNNQNFQNYQNYIQSIIQQAPRNSKKQWVSSETKILLTYANAICVICDKKIENFNQEEWQLIYQVFSYKNPYSIKYEVLRNILSQQQQRRRWSKRQQNILSELLKKCKKKNKWNNIARDLYIVSQGECYRQGKHCRQRFIKIQENQKSQNARQELQIQNDLEFLKSVQNQNIYKWKEVKKEFSTQQNATIIKNRIKILLEIESIQAEIPEQFGLKLQSKIKQLQSKQAKHPTLIANQIRKQVQPLSHRFENKIQQNQRSNQSAKNQERTWQDGMMNVGNRQEIFVSEQPKLSSIYPINNSLNEFQSFNYQWTYPTQPMVYQSSGFFVPPAYMNWMQPANPYNQNFGSGQNGFGNFYNT